MISIFEAGLNAINTKNVLAKTVARIDNEIKIGNNFFKIENGGKFFIVAVGKCAFQAGQELENIFGDLIFGGIVLGIGEKNENVTHLKYYSGTHPLPSEENVLATKQIIELLSGKSDKDVVLFIISGGASTLLCQPQSMNFETESAVFKILTSGGANIHELNTVRKHLSSARGGNLAKLAYPARIISLIFSDIPGNDISVVASGPTTLDRTTNNDALEILKKYKVQDQIPNIFDELIETPKEDKFFSNTKNVLAVTNDIALSAMLRKARDLKYQTAIVDNELTGEAKECGKSIANSISRQIVIHVFYMVEKQLYQLMVMESEEEIENLLWVRYWQISQKF